MVSRKKEKPGRKLKQSVSISRPFQAALARIVPIDMIVRGLDISLQDFRVLTTSSRRGELPAKRSSRIRLVYVLQGRATVDTTKHKEVLNPGQGVIVPAHRTIGLRLGRRTVVWVAGVQLRGGPAKRLCDCFPESDVERGLVPTAHDQAFAVAQTIHDLQHGRCGAWRERIFASLLRAWYALLIGRCFAGRRLQWRVRGEEVSERIGERICDEAVAVMRESLDESISVDDIARAVGLSGRHLNRLFQRHREKSVHQTLLELRLTYARTLLEKRPELSIKQVSHRCGFQRPAHFTQAFKKRFHLLPREVRASG